MIVNHKCHMSVLSCNAHGCLVILSHVLLSLFDPSPLLSDYWFICSTCQPGYPPLFAPLFSLPVFAVLCSFVVFVTYVVA